MKFPISNDPAPGCDKTSLNKVGTILGVVYLVDMQTPLFRRRSVPFWWLTVLLLLTVFRFTATADLIIYSNSLASGWVDYSWGSTINFANTAPVHSSGNSISVAASNWGALYLDCTDMSVSGYTNLSFWINGGTGGQAVQVQAVLGSASQATIQIGPLPANSWKQVNLSTDTLGITGAGNFTGFWIQCETTGTSPTFYVDDIVLQTGQAVVKTNAAIALRVDAAANRHPISPLIYGTAFATSNQIADLNFTLNRSGGNGETRYNWLLNAHNLGNDWYFESYPDASATPGASADEHVANSKAGGAQAMITIPMIGWMPKLGSGRSVIPSYSVAKYGAQTSVDPYLPNAGNGVSSATGLEMTNNDPTDANFPTNSTFQQGYVQHLISRWGNSTNGGVKYYFMDNEQSIWHSTHRDVHPIGPTMQEIRDKIFDYASMVKSNDPNALVCAPEEFGWSGYFFSGYDQQWSGIHNDYNTANFPDRQAHGGMDYVPWLLTQIHQRDMSTGHPLLDYFTLHCYPQGNEFSDDVSASTQILRNQSTRQLWDTNYVDQSWIGSQATNNILMLIPRMKNWVASCYPGLKTGITEYNWGAESHINGATAQADVLGILGREGLDMATRWTTPATNTPTYLAMKIYRNYDGNKSTFGDVSVATTVLNPDNLSVFAAIRTNDNALTIMAINKTSTGLTPMVLALTNFTGTGTAQAWQLTSGNVITRLADIAYTGGVLSNQLPAQSITLFVLPGIQTASFHVGTNAAPHQMELWLDGQAGQSYILQSSTNLINWLPVSTNTFTSNSFRWLLSTTNATKMFYRGRLNLP